MGSEKPENSVLNRFLTTKIVLHPEILHADNDGVVTLTTSSGDSSIFLLSGLFTDLFQVIVLSENTTLDNLSKVIASFPRNQLQGLSPSALEFQEAFITFFNFLIAENFLISDLKVKSEGENIKIENSICKAEIKKLTTDEFDIPGLNLDDKELAAMAHSSCAGGSCGGGCGPTCGCSACHS